MALPAAAAGLDECCAAPLEAAVAGDHIWYAQPRACGLRAIGSPTVGARRQTD